MCARVTGAPRPLPGRRVPMTPAGRKLTSPISSSKCRTWRSQSRRRLAVASASTARWRPRAEILASDRLSEFSGGPVDPNASKGNDDRAGAHGPAGQARPDQGRHDLFAHRRSDGFSADKLVMNQKLEANFAEGHSQQSGLIRSRATSRSTGRPASLDYRKPRAMAMPMCGCSATLDDASRARLGLDLGPAVSRAVSRSRLSARSPPVDRDSKLGVEADLTSVKLDNILPGWVKLPGNAEPHRASTWCRRQGRHDPSGGHCRRGRRRFDQGLASKSTRTVTSSSANFPTYSPSDGDKSVAEGRTVVAGRRGESHDARRRVRRPRFPEVGDFRQGWRRIPRAKTKSVRLRSST